ncbi:Cryptochrome/photolyase FAD-binding domain-containing protein [Coprinopsis marcescibilis]|uniref:Cryptochrome/photolyase FAD-binding domain-containing protein n=1 Tax=Coprinopsis marcescibilis TaxID=230819 RepID=A0A5C3L8M5_COPMA|nr:Cryptochrome/photolyase FAD-binding domain-containing protein [Coprinopsis marcescibilis]
MSKHTLQPLEGLERSVSEDIHRPNKRQRITAASFSPIKIATKENAAAADANPPLQRLLKAMREVDSGPNQGDCVVYWMRMSDMRVTDNRALSQASEQACRHNIPLVVLFIVSPQDYKAHDRSARKIDFALRNLSSVKTRLEELHIPLKAVTIARRKNVPSNMLSLMASLGATQLFANIEYEVDELRRDIELCQLAKKQQTKIRLFHNKSIVEPGIITSKGGKPYAVYSPYQKQWISVVNAAIARYLEEAKHPEANQPSIRSCPKLGELFNSALPVSVAGFELEDDDATAMKELWPEGEDKAKEVLRRFMKTKSRTSQLEANGPLSHGAETDHKHNRMSEYHLERDRADKDTTSRLSPYLSLGVISPRAVLRALLLESGSQKVDNSSNTGAGRFVQEMAWRDFYTDVLASFPRISMGRPFIEKFSAVVWENHQAPNKANLDQSVRDQDSEAVRRWKAGMTGVPIVDAAMRCLNKMGWVHNRVRMIVAMYLTKHLMIDWRIGERYFMEKLIDGDLSSNNGGWQWSASTGVDPCPYFRIFNPHTQSSKESLTLRNPKGDFIRHWVPELRRVYGPDLHNPSISIAKRLEYPIPIIEHKAGRERALRRFKTPGEE